MAHTQILVHRWRGGGRQNKDFLIVSQMNFTRSLVLSVVQAYNCTKTQRTSRKTVFPCTLVQAMKNYGCSVSIFQVFGEDLPIYVGFSWNRISYSTVCSWSCVVGSITMFLIIFSAFQ